MDPDEYPMDSKCYQIGEVIGIGMRSVVHKAHRISNSNSSTSSNPVVAIKIIDFEKSVEDMERVVNKAKNMAAFITHPNILKPHCIFTVGDTLWVVMPFLSGVSVLSIIARTRANTYPNYPGLSHQYIAALLKGICSALCHLHRRGQMHGDVKPGNILVDSDGSVKLGDLGFSASVCGSNDLMELETPLYWVAPEMVFGGSNIRSDIWSFGITALELAHGGPPLSHLPQCDSLTKKVNRRFGVVDHFHTENVGGLSRNMRFTDPVTWWSCEGLKNMVARCLDNNELSRASAEELMEHQFFKKCTTPEHFISRHIVSNRSYHGAPPWANNNVMLGILGWKLDEERFEMDVERGGGGGGGRAEVELLQKVLRKNVELQKMKRKWKITSENRKKMKNKTQETKSTEEDGVGEEEIKRIIVR